MRMTEMQQTRGKQMLLSRRAFLKNGTLVLTAAAIDPLSIATVLADSSAASVLRFGLVTDLHYADKPPAGSRHYRETLSKLAEAAEQFHKHKPAFVAELGDFIDAADTIEGEKTYLRRINRDFSALAC